MVEVLPPLSFFWPWFLFCDTVKNGSYGGPIQIWSWTKFWSKGLMIHWPTTVREQEFWEPFLRQGLLTWKKFWWIRYWKKLPRFRCLIFIHKWSPQLVKLTLQLLIFNYRVQMFLTLMLSWERLESLCLLGISQLRFAYIGHINIHLVISHFL